MVDFFFEQFGGPFTTFKFEFYFEKIIYAFSKLNILNVVKNIKIIFNRLWQPHLPQRRFADSWPSTRQNRPFAQIFFINYSNGKLSQFSRQYNIYIEYNNCRQNSGLLRSTNPLREMGKMEPLAISRGGGAGQHKSKHFVPSVR